MKTLLTAVLMAITAPVFGATIYHMPMGTATNWNPGLTNVLTGSQFYQCAETNNTILQAQVTAINATLGGIADADTNSIVRSPRIVAVSTNGFTWTDGNTNFLTWATVTNPAGVSYTMPAGGAYLRYSTDGGSNWIEGGASLVTTGEVKYAFWPLGVSTPSAVNPVVTNFIVYTQTRPDLCFRTNQSYGQTIEVQSPIGDMDATPKSYVDGVVAAAISSQQGPSQLNGNPLEFSPIWEVSSTSSTTNTGTWQVNHFGVPILQVISPVASAVTIARISVSGTNVSVFVPTNGLAAAPTLQVTRKLSPLNWFWQAATNGISGTNYAIGFGRPWNDTCFVRAAVPFTLPSVVSIGSGVWDAVPFTVTNATDSTYGFGAGLARWDTNYLYISVGTNQWKRVALTGW